MSRSSDSLKWISPPTAAALVVGAAVGSAALPEAAAETASFATADTTLSIARLQYDGGGDWYANPSSLPNLLRAITDWTGLPVAPREATVTPLDPALRDHPYIYMTGHGNVRFTPQERDAIRGYLLAGGFLHADDNYGMDESFRREMAAIFPDRELVELPADHPVFHLAFDFPEPFLLSFELETLGPLLFELR